MTERDAGQHDRIDHRLADLLAQAVPRLRVFGQPLENGVELARLLARRHGGAVDHREGVREVVEADGQRVALEHLAADAEHDALEPGLLGVLADGEQRFLERQAGAHQGGELAGQQREVEA